MKQIIVMRTDLGMGVGKMIAQGAHASMKVTQLHFNDERVKSWLDGAFTKIVVEVGSEQELLKVYDKAKEHGLLVERIDDNGRTVFNNNVTLTCIAVGPDTHENLKPVTGRLRLMK